MADLSPLLFLLHRTPRSHFLSLSLPTSLIIILFVSDFPCFVNRCVLMDNNYTLIVNQILIFTTPKLLSASKLARLHRPTNAYSILMINPSIYSCELSNMTTHLFSMIYWASVSFGGRKTGQKPRNSRRKTMHT